MIERKNIRLVGILTLWFLTAAVIPSLVIFVSTRARTREQQIARANHSMGFLLRSRATALERTLDQLAGALNASSRRLNVLFSDSGTSGVVISEFLAREDGAGALSTGRLYFIGPDEKIIPDSLPREASLLLPERGAAAEKGATISEDGIFMWQKIESANATLALHVPWDIIAQELRADINDRSFYSARSPDESSYAFGDTVDIALTDSTSNIFLVKPLTGSPTVARALAARLDTHQTGITTRIQTIGGDSILTGSYSFTPTHATSAVVIVAAQSIDDALLTSSDDHSQRELLTWIASLVGLFALLYVFVVRFGKTVVQPIYGSVRDLSSLGERLTQSITSTEEVVKTQLRAARQLVDIYTAHTKDIKKVNNELNAIVSEFRSIGSQTAIAAAGARGIEGKAREGEERAHQASASLGDIQHLASSHEVAVSILEEYVREIRNIAEDIESLSRSITYLSLNATIEGAGDQRAHKNVARMASEAGKLSRVSNESSARIHELLHRMQASLQKTKQSAKLEIAGAHTSMSIMNEALENLTTMSRDTRAIGKSVQTINALIASQEQRIGVIYARSEDVAAKATATMDTAVTVKDIAEQQRATIKTQNAVWKKLRGTIETLQSLIDRKKS